ncbi:MAG: glycosyltransferase family 4 protein [Egibacteraceae bacterium]
MTPPRALWVTNDLPPRSGGIEQFLANLLARTAPDATRVLASDQPGAAARDATLDYEVRRIGRWPLLPTPAVLRRVRAEARDHDADVVVFGASWPLGELAGHLDLPCLALSHGHEAGLARVGLGPLVRRVARNLAVLGVISEFTRSQLAPWVGGHTTVRWLPPGADIDRFHPGVDPTPVRARHGLDDGRPLVVCVSRLVRRKGQDVLVETWPRVRRVVPGAHLLLAGGGPLAQRLAWRVRALDLEQDVTFAGDVPWPQLPGYYAAADVFAMPCRTRLGGLDVEGLGIVYLEAQACGVPVVAGRSGGAPEALVDGETGVTVDGGAVSDVADTVVGLLGDRDVAAAMGAAGRAFVERHYAWDAVAARFHRVVAETVRPARPL